MAVDTEQTYDDGLVEPDTGQSIDPAIAQSDVTVADDGSITRVYEEITQSVSDAVTAIGNYVLN